MGTMSQVATERVASRPARDRRGSWVPETCMNGVARRWVERGGEQVKTPAPAERRGLRF